MLWFLLFWIELRYELVWRRVCHRGYSLPSYFGSIVTWRILKLYTRQFMNNDIIVLRIPVTLRLWFLIHNSGSLALVAWSQYVHKRLYDNIRPESLSRGWQHHKYIEINPSCFTISAHRSLYSTPSHAIFTPCRELPSLYSRQTIMGMLISSTRFLLRDFFRYNESLYNVQSVATSSLI